MTMRDTRALFHPPRHYHHLIVDVGLSAGVLSVLALIGALGLLLLKH